MAAEQKAAMPILSNIYISTEKILFTSLEENNRYKEIIMPVEI